MTSNVRGELGLRGDKSVAMRVNVLTLRGRVAWAHVFSRTTEGYAGKGTIRYTW